MYYLFVVHDRSHLEGGLLQFVLTIHKIIKKNSTQQLSIYGRTFVPNNRLQLLFCTWAIYSIRIFPIPMGRNPGPSGPATVRAME